MNREFDELTKNLARSVSRRAALKKFCVGLTGMVLACFGLASKGEAGGCHPTGYLCYSGTKGSTRGHCNNCCSGGFTCGGLGGVTTCYCN